MNQNQSSKQAALRRAKYDQQAAAQAYALATMEIQKLDAKFLATLRFADYTISEVLMDFIAELQTKGIVTYIEMTPVTLMIDIWSDKEVGWVVETLLENYITGTAISEEERQLRIAHFNHSLQNFLI